MGQAGRAKKNERGRTMTDLTRRGLLAGVGGVLALAGCGNPVGGTGPDVLDARVDAMRDFLFANYPGTRDLESQAAGVLFMPLITEGGFFVGGGYGRGALRIDGVTVDYYSATRATVGLQVGAQQYAHALFFMTPEALEGFRRAEGWAAGVDARVANFEGGMAAGVDTTTETAPVLAVVFGQAGLMAGAAIAGTKYTRIIP
jgi:lipid-binding SYLF domain-containing protein